MTRPDVIRPDERTYKTNPSRKGLPGHQGYGRTKASILRMTPEQSAREQIAWAASGYPTLNDYRLAVLIRDICGDEPIGPSEEETEEAPPQRAESHVEEPFSFPADPPRDETPIPAPTLAARFWEAVSSIVGDSEFFWTWIDKSFPLVEYGACVELSVPSPMIKSFTLERAWEQSVFGKALAAIGVEKPIVLAIRPKAPQADASPTPKDKPKDAILADIEAEMAAQKALDPRRTNEGVKSQLAVLTALYFARLRELTGKRKGQNHIVEWRRAAMKKGASAFESTGPISKSDVTDALRAMRKKDTS